MSSLFDASRFNQRSDLPNRNIFSFLAYGGYPRGGGDQSRYAKWIGPVPIRNDQVMNASRGRKVGRF